MKAISLWNPWASAIAHGSKTFETRGWKPGTGMLLVDIAIHAAKRKPRVDDLGEWGPSFKRMSPSFFGCEWEDLPLGAIVATARIGRIFATTELVHSDGVTPTDYGRSVRMSPIDALLGNYEPGRFAWRLTDVIRLPEPIPCTGRQGFWTLDEETAFKVAQATIGGTR